MEVRSPLGPRPDSIVSPENGSPGPKSPGSIGGFEDGFDLVESANQVNLEEKHLSPLHSELGKINFFTRNEKTKRAELGNQIKETQGHIDAVTATADKISTVTKKPVAQETLDSLYRMRAEQPEDYKKIDNHWSKALADATKTEVPVAQKASFETAKAELLEAARPKQNSESSWIEFHQRTDAEKIQENEEQENRNRLIGLNTQLRDKKEQFYNEATEQQKDKDPEKIYQNKVNIWLKNNKTTRKAVESVNSSFDRPGFLSPAEKKAKVQADQEKIRTKDTALLVTYFATHPRDKEYEKLKKTPETYTAPRYEGITESAKQKDEDTWKANREALKAKEIALRSLAQTTKQEDAELAEYIRNNPNTPEVKSFLESLA